MSDTRRKSDTENELPGQPTTPKKPYAKPSFRSEQIFEAALQGPCAKLAGTNPACSHVPKNS